MHVVIKTESREFGKKDRRFSFLQRERQIQAYLDLVAKRSGIRVYRAVIMSNHIHFILKCDFRNSLKRFLRELSGFLGRTFTLAGGLFTGRRFSRILEWGKDYLGTHRYFDLNEIEKTGKSKGSARSILKEFRNPTHWQ